jgi:ATP-dependent Clp protease ATP-binding subunit ClpC
VCRLLIDDVNEALRYKNVTVEIDDEAVEWLLARAGEDPHMGARPLRRAIQKYVEDRISESLIVDREEKISSFMVSVEGDELSVAARDKETVIQVD